MVSSSAMCPLSVSDRREVQRPVVAAPRDSSFDVGRLEGADKAAIPLALVKPLVLRPVLINRDEDEDNLKLTALLRLKPRETGKARPGRCKGWFGSVIHPAPLSPPVVAANALKTHPR